MKSVFVGENWHCFDMPFVMMCSNYSFAKEIYEIFAPYEKNMRTFFQIALEGQFETDREGNKKDAEFIAASREGWPHAIERAIKAEAENAKLRKVVGAAEKYFYKSCPSSVHYEQLRIDLQQALAELDKEGESR